MTAAPVIDCRRCRIHVPVEEMQVIIWRGMPTKIGSGRCLNCGHTTAGVLICDENEDVRLLDLVATAQEGVMA